MAYSELIKNFDKVRDYMREFYVFGFKTREELAKKSSRSYDNERRRIESYLADYMAFRQTSSGKNVFLSIDSRQIAHNPLYDALKAKSFTDGDITLHFILLDILHSSQTEQSLKEILHKIHKEYLSFCKLPLVFDESTVRNKLNEYIELGIFKSRKLSKAMMYSRREDMDLSGWQEAISFFSEVALEGAVGSYLLDWINGGASPFLFKHHYIGQALESVILYEILQGMEQKREIHITTVPNDSPCENRVDVIPLKIFVSVQSGRRYLMGFDLHLNRIRPFRLDYMTGIQLGACHGQFEEKRNQLLKMEPYLWGVSCPNRLDHMEHVTFTLHLEEGEEHIFQRLFCEKRCGRVERVDCNTCIFSADVYDSNELLPWIRTFIGRIQSIRFSNQKVGKCFSRDLENMYQLYGLEASPHDIS